MGDAVLGGSGEMLPQQFLRLRNEKFLPDSERHGRRDVDQSCHRLQGAVPCAGVAPSPETWQAGEGSGIDDLKVNRPFQTSLGGMHQPPHFLDFANEKGFAGAEGHRNGKVEELHAFVDCERQMLVFT